MVKHLFNMKVNELSQFCTRGEAIRFREMLCEDMKTPGYNQLLFHKRHCRLRMKLGLDLIISAIRMEESGKNEQIKDIHQEL